MSVTAVCEIGLHVLFSINLAHVNLLFACFSALALMAMAWGAHLIILSPFVCLLSWLPRCNFHHRAEEFAGLLVSPYRCRRPLACDLMPLKSLHSRPV